MPSMPSMQRSVTGGQHLTESTVTNSGFSGFEMEYAWWKDAA
jgi:hypothetical protein